MKQSLYFRGILLILLITAGCAINKPVPFQGLEKQTTQQTEDLVTLIQDQYPDRFNALHRVALNIQDKTIILKGFLKVDRPKGEVHLVAQSDMGGTLFAIHILNGKPETITTKGFFKKSWLEASVVKDLKLYLLPVFNSPNAYTDREGKIILSDIQEGMTRSYIFIKREKAGPRLSEYRELNKEGLNYKIHYDYESGSVLPGLMTIHNKKSGYTLNINVRYMIPRTP